MPRKEPRTMPDNPVTAPAGQPPVAWEQQSKGERLSHNVDLGLEFTRRLLELPFDPDNLKLLGHQKDAALTLISQQIRIEAERMRAPRGAGGSIADFYKDGGEDS